jgi:hypothetical protein
LRAAQEIGDQCDALTRVLAQEIDRHRGLIGSHADADFAAHPGGSFGDVIRAARSRAFLEHLAGEIREPGLLAFVEIAGLQDRHDGGLRDRAPLDHREVETVGERALDLVRNPEVLGLGGRGRRLCGERHARETEQQECGASH